MTFSCPVGYLILIAGSVVIITEWWAESVFMQMQMKMNTYRGLVLFQICLYSVYFAAAKCVPERCGKVSLSFPFWIHNPNCGYPGFRIKCLREKNSEAWAPFLPALVEVKNDGNMKRANFNFKIMEINYTGYLIINSTSLKAWSCSQYDDATILFQLSPEGPFTISTSNRFVVIGCHTSGTYRYGKWGDVRCVSICETRQDQAYCNYGCCEIVLPDNWKWINFTGAGLFDYKTVERCGFSTILDPSTFQIVDKTTDLFWGEGRKASYGLRLNWGVGLQNCSIAKSTTNYSCSSNAECIDSPTEEGHVCKCLPGYEGSGYSNGTSCTDVDECSRGDLNKCIEPSKGGRCHNLAGSYECSCAKGYKGNGSICESTSSKKAIIYAIIGSVSSFVGVSLGASVIFWWIRRCQLKHARDKYFKQNGGVQLQERIALMGGKKSLTIFSEKELEIASNNYSTELGRGGFATVYKGVLLDGLQVAIKKPRAISDEFINEITIFSHINHINIVKVLGCCLETQYPLLVYEFVPNGTLFEHLHKEEKFFPWEMRRRIAIEVADAIAYMHLQVSPQILHRDIKSSNILIDDTFTPKVSDFGISRLQPSDATHLSTMAAGTPGYLDPEVITRDQYTDKSDVFSYGVVLVELLTSQKPLLSLEGTVCTLYDYFLLKMNQNALTEILDPNVVNEKNQGQMESMARLAEACLQMKSKARPSMREVVEKLVWIRAKPKQLELHRDASLNKKKEDLTRKTLKDYNFPVTGASTSHEDSYYWSTPSEIVVAEDPLTAMIQVQMSDMDGR